ncbi:hypothetical protein AAH145_05520 [Bacteroides thetaiotaomicron]|uniref:hypothetical protein n=1 Tax=Bacteroidaceae TaxID=815 RepID=UPI0039B5AD48
MKTGILTIISVLFVSVSYVSAQSYVFGFSNNTTITCPQGSRTNYHTDSGYGGNYFVWSVQNGSAYGFDLSPVVSVDYRQESYSVVSVPGGGIANDVYEKPITTRNEPFYWQMNFLFQWDQYAEFVNRSVYIAYSVNDWNPEDYKDIWSKKIGVKDTIQNK